MIKPHLQYLAYVLRHKWYVLVGGLRLGVPLWRLVIHDWTKFTPAEWKPYVDRFYGPKPPTLGATGYFHNIGDHEAFDLAWLHHWRNNPHHWQYWLSPPDFWPTPMPETYIREMVADWYGAGMAQSKPDIVGWYAANKDKIDLHSETREIAERLLDQVGEW